MSEIFDLALVYSPHEWVESFHRHCMNTGTLRIRSLIYEISALKQEPIDACVIADTHPALSASLINSLHENDVIVIGICENNKSNKMFLSEIGVDAIFYSSLKSTELTIEIEKIIKTIKIQSNENNSDVNLEKFASAVEEDKSPTHTNMGSITSVIGTGGVGCTEIALHLSFARTGSLLIDLDFEHPSLAMRLNAEIEPHIIDAIECSHNNPENFHSTIQKTKQINLLSGTSHFSYSEDVRDYEIISLLETATKTFSSVICDMGRLSFGLPSQVAASTIKSSNVLLIVGDATPLGLIRLMEIISHISATYDLLNNCKIYAVLNRASNHTDLNNQLISEIKAIDLIDQVFLVHESKHFINLAWKGAFNKSKNFRNSILQIKKTIESNTTDTPNEESGEKTPKTTSGNLIRDEVSA